MKAYLHGVHAGKTITLGKIEFTDGVANLGSISNYLSRCYNVRDHAPEGLVVEEEVKEVAVQADDEGQQELRNVVEAKKAEIKADSMIKTSADFESLPQYRAYVAEVTGNTYKRKSQCDAAMKQYAMDKGIS